MKIRCEVIRDLLPLYVDDIVSDESRRLIEEHIAECEDCRAYLKELFDSEDESLRQDFVDEMKPLKRIRRKEMINRVALIVILLAFVAMAGGFLSLFVTDESWRLQDHVAYTVPEGYEFKSSDSDDSRCVYVREKDDTFETLSVCYEGSMSRALANGEEKIPVGDGWEGWIYRSDDDHSYYNRLYGAMKYDGDNIEIEYFCRYTDKGYYYDSCSEEQGEELVEFMRTFEHRGPPLEGNLLKRLWQNIGLGGLLMIGPIILIIIGIPVAIMVSSIVGSGENKGNRGEPVSSRQLHAKMNEERCKQGEGSIPAINNMGGVSTNNLARRDKSWNSVPDFFIKMFRNKSNK